MNQSRPAALQPGSNHSPQPQPQAPRPVIADQEPIELVELEELTPATPAPAAHPVPQGHPTPATAATAAPVTHGPATIQPSSKIRQQVLMGAGGAQRAAFKRTPVCNGRGSCRVRTFHGRMSDEGMAYMDDKINEWLDAHPEIEVKFVTTAIGMYDGKIREEALVVNVWY